MAGFGATKDDKSLRRGQIGIQDTLKLMTNPQVVISVTDNGGFVISVVSKTKNELYMASRLDEALDIVKYHTELFLAKKE